MRLDLYLVENQYCLTRSQATDYIKRGLVLVNQVTAKKPGQEVNQSDVIKLTQISSFVSRAGEKLLQALLDFNIDLHDKICIDIGSSTGGFTDCAIQHGAKRIYAYDVGKDQMDDRLKNHPQIILNESMNILDVEIPFSHMIFIDVSFTSIKPILKHLKGFEHEMICLIKPQYEAGLMKFKQGVLKDSKVHKTILIDVLNYARELNFEIKGLIKSTLKGKSGNQEYILYIKPSKQMIDIKKIVGEVLC